MTGTVQAEGTLVGKAHAYSDVGVLVVPGKIQHVIQSQHAWRDLGEIHSWVDVVLRKRETCQFFSANLFFFCFRH